jgi:hypothetical protein
MTASANIANTKVVPIESRGAPYYDDYNEDKNFYRILIRPGYPIQARELTQMQTMAQVQTERFGRSIYDNGSIVQGGQISIDTTGVTLNLATQYANVDVNVSQFLNQTIAYGSSNTLVQAYVIGATANSTTEPPALVIKYLTGNKFQSGDTIMVPNTAIFANLAATDANTPAAIASVSDGIFFFNGFFVRAPGQSTIASKYTTAANARIGLAITDQIITEASDTSLLDPAQESSNYQAPGGARYKIDLTLTTRSLTSTDDSAFIELLRMENGVVKKKVVYPVYSDLEDTLARRTFDESGSYTVRAFRLNLSDNSSNANTYIATIDPGKAYVHGYEFETIAPTQIIVPRARDTTTVSNYPLNMSYGNYLTVSEGRGYLDHSEPMIIDLHCVPHQMIANIATPATTPVGAQYRSTKIGTGRVRMVTYDSAANTGNAQSRVYRLYMFDTVYSNLRSNVSTVISANTILLYDPNAQNTFSSQTSAYVGATIRFTSGPGTGQMAVIAGYSVNATGHKFVTTNTVFTTTPTNATNVSIDFDTKDLKAVAGTGGSSNTGANTLWTKYNVTQASRSGGSTYFQESTDPSLVFPFPQDFIKAGSLLAPSVPNYQYKKVFTGVAFTAGTITTPTGGIQVDGINESFVTSSGVSSGTSTAVLTNYIVYVTAAGTSGRSNGDIVQLGTITTTGGGGSTHFVQMTTDGSAPASPDTFTATIVATVQIIAGGETGPKTKVRYNASNTVFNPVPQASNGSFQQLYQDPVTGYSTVANTTVYLQAGQVVIQNPFRNPGAKMSLYIPDAIRISKIWDMGVGTGFPAPASSLTGFTDVTTRFNFDNGQTDTHYGHSSISLKNSAQSPSGNLVACVDWYDHAAGYTSSGLGYFSVDSYPNSANTGYAEIPSATLSDGLTYALRDCLDFRPRVTPASNAAIGNQVYQGLRLSVPNYNFQTVQYQYFLSRIDKLVLTKDRQFKLIQGVPAVNPVEPGNITDSMILYKLYTPAYTLYTANVDVTYQENRRYTMRDIGALEQRITNLEYYTTLSLLEKDATDTTITDALGLSRAKYGIIVDSFTGHSIGDVSSTDYDCAMDVDTGGMVPRNFATATPLYYASNSGITIASQAATLAYTEEVMVTQPAATKTENIQPYMFAIYAGTLKMFPDADIWVDTITAPAVIINPSGQNDNLITVPPAQNGNAPRANTVPRPDPHGGRRRWWQIGWFGRRSSRRRRT